jgi:pilus assembly protein CpaE
MNDANRALKNDPLMEDDDPFMDASDIERLMLGEATREDILVEDRAQSPGKAFGAGATLDPDVLDESADPYMSEPHFDAPEEAVTVDPAFDELREEVAQSTAAMPGGETLYGEVDAEVSEQPIPRIAIAAFCERPETGALIHNAADDRRLARAHVDVELGGLPAAIERFHDATTPNLLIVESGMRGRGLFEQLEELAAVCDADTKVVVIGASNDISLYRGLMKRGVSEYLVPPMTPLHLIRTISDLFLDPEQPFAGKTVAFIGAKGGVGSSTIAHNASWALTEGLQSDAVLVDMDLSFGTAGLDFNQDPAQTLGDALAEPDRLDEALLDRLLVRCTDRLSLFSAPATLERDWEFSPVAYEMVLEKVRRQAPNIILDLPHFWMPWVKQTLLSADEVVLTVTPDLASLRNAKNLFDLVTGARPNDDPPKVVINMAGIPKRPEIPIKDFADALGAPPVLVLPFEPMLFGKASNNGQMITEVDPKSKAAEGFAHLASMITGRVAAPNKKRSLFGNLFGG